MGIAAGSCGLLLGMGGCANQPAKRHVSPAMVGYVDLDKLVRYNPGWHGVAQFDTALVRVKDAKSQLPSAASTDSSLAELPAVQLEAPTAPGIQTKVERHRMEAVGRRQVTHLAAGLAMARHRQLMREQRTWDAEADDQYRTTVQNIEHGYGVQYGHIYAESELKQLNLTLQVRALKNLIQHWALSVPPAAELESKKRELAEKETELLFQDASRAALLTQATLDRANAVHDALNAKAAYVAKKRDATDSELQVQDQRQIALEQKNLQVQRDALLADIKHAETTTVPASGTLGVAKLPTESLAGTVSASAQRLTQAQHRLQAQRARWIASLYDDSRAASQDVAQDKHWTLTFKRSGSAVPDLTSQVASALGGSLWKQ